MAVTLNQIDQVLDGQVIKAGHISQSLVAFSGRAAYNINLSGSFAVTGSMYHSEVSDAAGVASSVLVRDNTTGEYYTTGSYGDGGGEGAAGSSGSSGTSGADGSSGSSGTSGSSGSSGTSGADGSSGSSGTSGVGGVTTAGSNVAVTGTGTAIDPYVISSNISGSGTLIFSQTDVIDAQRDATDTTVLFSNGDIFAVNSLHASAMANGTIKISTVRGGKDIYTHIRYYNVSVLNGGVTGFNTIEAAVDRLNEVLGGTTVGSDTGSPSPTITTTSNSSDFTVYGERITETGSGTTLGYTSTADADNFDTSNGIYSNQTISKNGEYFEFEQALGDWTNSSDVYIGLFDETTYNVEDLNVNSAGDAVKGLLYLKLYPTPVTYADATNGAGKINEIGFSNSPQTKAKFRLGRDNDGRVYIAHETSPNVFEVICRSESVIAIDTELRFFSIMPGDNELNGVRNMTVNEAVLGATLTWYYVESPDTEFYYPLFSNEADAILIDELYGTAASGAGTAHTHTFIDEQPTSQTWYMPDTYMTHSGAAAPTTPAGISWNEIRTGDDVNYVPSPFNQSITVVEGDNINLQIKPAGDANTYAISNIPVGLAYNSISGHLQGTAPEVTGDNVANPSDLYSITVTIANSYGSSVGSLELTITNEDAPVNTIVTPWTKAVDFSSGGNEHLRHNSGYAAVNSNNGNPLAISSGTYITKNANHLYTATSPDSRPWASTVVFKADGHNSLQTIWNNGEGFFSGGDNFGLEIDGNNTLWFYWGHGSLTYSSYNRCSVAINIDTSKWHGVYIAHKGGRQSSANATPDKLGACFDIRVMSSADNFTTLSPNMSGISGGGNWQGHGRRMDKIVNGYYTIGASATGTKPFYGKVASSVITTLKNNSLAPVAAEIKLMITDPKKWETDYKQGTTYRLSDSSTTASVPVNPTTNYNYATQIHLMGDSVGIYPYGAYDAYPDIFNNLRWYSTTKMVMQNMQANDIETVNIPGLT